MVELDIYSTASLVLSHTFHFQGVPSSRRGRKRVQYHCGEWCVGEFGCIQCQVLHFNSLESHLPNLIQRKYNRLVLYTMLPWQAICPSKCQVHTLLNGFLIGAGMCSTVYYFFIEFFPGTLHLPEQESRPGLT